MDKIYLVGSFLFACPRQFLKKKTLLPSPPKVSPGSDLRLELTGIDKKYHLTKQQLYGHLPLISQTIQVRRTRHAGYCPGNKDELITSGLQHMDTPVLADLQRLTYISAGAARGVMVIVLGNGHGDTSSTPGRG